MFFNVNIGSCISCISKAVLWTAVHAPKVTILHAGHASDLFDPAQYLSSSGWETATAAVVMLYGYGRLLHIRRFATAVDQDCHLGYIWPYDK